MCSLPWVGFLSDHITRVITREVYNTEPGVMAEKDAENAKMHNERLLLNRRNELNYWKKNAERIRGRNRVMGLAIGAFVVGMCILQRASDPGTPRKTWVYLTCTSQNCYVIRVRVRHLYGYGYTRIVLPWNGEFWSFYTSSIHYMRYAFTWANKFCSCFSQLW